MAILQKVGLDQMMALLKEKVKCFDKGEAEVPAGHL